MRFFRRKVPYTKEISISPPAAAIDRHGLAIAAVVKNEESYIAEWAAFHKAIGTRHFLIYNDGSTDSTVESLRCVLPSNCLTIIPWAGRMVDASKSQMLNSQAIAFAHAILNFGAQFKWMAFIDVDEFLLPKTGSTIEEALVKVNGHPNISLPWHMFGTSGHKKRPLGPVSRNYTFRGANPLSKKKNASNFKCIVDPCEVTKVSIHHFETRDFGDRTCNDVGRIANRKGRKKPSFYSSECLQLNHYYSKSQKELEAKLSRGPASPASRQRYELRVRTAMESIDSDVVEDTHMIGFLDRTRIPL
jgi:hypothetical protein